MSNKKALAKEINLIEKEMAELENKRTRSMAALMESLISKVDPDETEMQFFRQYSAEIEVKRERVSQLINQLKELI